MVQPGFLEHQRVQLVQQVQLLHLVLEGLEVQWVLKVQVGPEDLPDYPVLLAVLVLQAIPEVPLPREVQVVHVFLVVLLVRSGQVILVDLVAFEVLAVRVHQGVLDIL